MIKKYTLSNNENKVCGVPTQYLHIQNNEEGELNLEKTKRKAGLKESAVP